MVKPYAWIIVPAYAWDQADMDGRIVETARRIREDLGYIPFENANGSPSDGRLEQLQKDTVGFAGLAPETLQLVHQTEEPYFLASAGIVIEAAHKDEKIRKMIEKKVIVARQAA